MGAGVDGVAVERPLDFAAKRIDLQQRFDDAIAGILGIGGEDSSDRFACEALIAAVSSLVTARIGTGRAAELPQLREPLIELARRLSLSEVRR